METKLFEVRDRATLIPVVAIKLAPSTKGQARLIEQAGFWGLNAQILISNIDGGRGILTYDQDLHRLPGRTLKVAHEYIRNNFDVLHDCDIIDVEDILGEK